MTQSGHCPGIYCSYAKAKFLFDLNQIQSSRAQTTVNGSPRTRRRSRPRHCTLLISLTLQPPGDNNERR
jgi:hypothetical protein